MGLAIAGAVLVFIGFLFSITIIGAIIGVPMIIGGVIMMGVGVFGRRKTMITNVVQVSHAPAGQPLPSNTFSVGSGGFAVEPKRPSLPDPVTTCGGCSTSNDAASKFCKNCGAALAGAPA